MITVRKHTNKRDYGGLILDDWTEDQERKIAIEKGRGYYALRQEWLTFTGTGETFKNPSAVFVGFYKKRRLCDSKRSYLI